MKSGKFPKLFGKEKRGNGRGKTALNGDQLDRTVQAKVGEKIWASRRQDEDFSELWAVYEVASLSPDKKSVFLMDAFTKKIWEVSAEETLSYDFCHDQDFGDLTRMNYLHEASLLSMLHQRYLKDEIYTWFGDTMISINPYYDIDGLYDKKPPVEDPHVFSVADRAFTWLKKRKRSQSIVINGDSGAGKTEAAKQIMRHLVSLSTDSSGGTTPAIENLVLESTPVLEAFGNSITLRNDNSSRFGRFIQILYDDTGSAITGMNTLHFLLEKSRIITRSPGERNYHIFYQLCAGGASYGFKAPEEYTYLHPIIDSSNYTGVVPDDAANLERTKNALSTIGIAENVQECVWQVILAILSLGNVEFVTDEDDKANTGKCKLTEESSADLEACAHALGLESAEELENALVRRTMEAGKKNETTVIDLTVDQAKDSRDALAKFLYSSVFDWVIEELNRQSVLKATAGKKKKGKKKNRFIGVLDIFGFEDLEHNSFEQICVNYANELLQKQFDLHVVESERRLFKEEGVSFPDIELPSLVASEEVLQSLTGQVFATLEEQCLLRSGSDTGFLSNLKGKASDGTKVSLDWKSSTGFIVKHFAGEVSYDSTGFLDKNRDALTSDLKDIVFRTTNDVLKIQLKIGSSTPKAKNRKMAAKETVLKKFQSDMNNLVSTLTSTDQTFVRCIKPNHSQASKEWDVKLILAQLEYLGILQAIRVHEETYPVRRPFSFIPEKYLSILEEDGEEVNYVPGKNDQEIMRRIFFKVIGEESEGKMWECGYTKVFLGNEVLYALDNCINQRRLDGLAMMNDDEREAELEKERLRQEQELKNAKQRMEMEHKELLNSERMKLKQEEELLRKQLKAREEELRRQENERKAQWEQQEAQLKRQQELLEQEQKDKEERQRLFDLELQERKRKEEEVVQQAQYKLKELELQEKAKKEELEKLNKARQEHNEQLLRQQQDLLREQERIREQEERRKLEMQGREEQLRLENERLKLMEENRLLKEKFLEEQRESHRREKAEFDKREKQIWQDRANEMARKAEKARKKDKMQRREAKLNAVIKIQKLIRGFIIRRNYVDLKLKTAPYIPILKRPELVIFSSLIMNDAPTERGSKTKRRAMLLTTNRRILIVDPISLKIDQQGKYDPKICKAVAAGRESELHLYLLSDWLATDRSDWKIRDLLNAATTWVALLDTLTTAPNYIKHGLAKCMRKRVSRRNLDCPLRINYLKVVDDEGNSTLRSSKRKGKFMGGKGDRGMQFVLSKRDHIHTLKWYETEKDEIPAGKLTINKTMKILIPDHGAVNGKMNIFIFCIRVRRANRDKLYTLQARGLQDRSEWAELLRKIVRRDRFRKFAPVANPGFGRRADLTKKASSRNMRDSAANSKTLRASQRSKSRASSKTLREQKGASGSRDSQYRNSSKSATPSGTLRQSKKRIGKALSFGRGSKKAGGFSAQNFMSAFEEADVSTNQNLKSGSKKRR